MRRSHQGDRRGAAGNGRGCSGQRMCAVAADRGTKRFGGGDALLQEERVAQLKSAPPPRRARVPRHAAHVLRPRRLVHPQQGVAERQKDRPAQSVRGSCYVAAGMQKPHRGVPRRGFDEKNPAITYFRAGSTIMGPGCLTAVFGMGTGVATRVWSPGRSLSPSPRASLRALGVCPQGSQTRPGAWGAVSTGSGKSCCLVSSLPRGAGEESTRSSDWLLVRVS